MEAKPVKLQSLAPCKICFKMRSTAAVFLVTLAVCWTGFAAHPIISALKTRQVSQLIGTTCPDHSLCPSDSTCCEMSQGYGCCPGLDAVCCSDGLHCCKAGYSCDLAKQACIPERNTTDSKILKFDKMLTAKQINIMRSSLWHFLSR